MGVIEAQEAERRELLEALKPFAKLYADLSDPRLDDPNWGLGPNGDDLKRAHDTYVNAGGRL
jgi:hypothetical protein